MQFYEYIHCKALIATPNYVWYFSNEMKKKVNPSKLFEIFISKLLKWKASKYK